MPTQTSRSCRTRTESFKLRLKDTGAATPQWVEANRKKEGPCSHPGLAQGQLLVHKMQQVLHSVLPFYMRTVVPKVTLMMVSNC